MEKSTLKHRIEVMQAYLDGKTIEYDKFNSHYVECENPDFNWYFHNYRIKEVEADVKLAKNLLPVFGYSIEFGLQEQINEIFNLDAGGNPLTFLQMFLLRVSDKDMKELKKIVSE